MNNRGPNVFHRVVGGTSPLRRQSNTQKEMYISDFFAKFKPRSRKTNEEPLNKQTSESRLLGGEDVTNTWLRLKPRDTVSMQLNSCTKW